MKTIKILEITTQAQPEIRDEDDNVTQESIEEVSQVLVDGGFAYQEELCLSELIPDFHEQIKKDKEEQIIPTRWEQMSDEDKLAEYSARRIHAYQSEFTRLKAKYPEKNLVVRIIESE